MKKKTTILLLIITGVLFAMVIYIGFSLQGEKPTEMTTIKKTKASSITYSKTLDVNSADAPSPTAVILALALTPTPTIQPTNVMNNPTQALTVTPTTVQTNTPAAAKTLPVTAGKVDYTATFVALASLLIFISFIY